jgi:hypothetical protein
MPVNGKCPCDSTTKFIQDHKCIPCHTSCLTCNGPEKNNCLTCVNGSAVDGECSCGNSKFSSNY